MEMHLKYTMTTRSNVIMTYFCRFVMLKERGLISMKVLTLLAAVCGQLQVWLIFTKLQRITELFPYENNSVIPWFSSQWRFSINQWAPEPFMRKLNLFLPKEVLLWPYIALHLSPFIGIFRITSFGSFLRLLCKLNKYMYIKALTVRNKTI